MFIFLQDCEKLGNFESFFSPNHQIKKQVVGQRKGPLYPVPQCLCSINLPILIHSQNTKESQRFHQEFTGHISKLLFSLQKFPKAKARAAHLTQGASSSTSGNQIQPAGQIHLLCLGFIVTVPSPVCLCMPMHFVSASLSLPGIESGREKRAKGLWEITEFWTLSQKIFSKFV